MKGLVSILIILFLLIGCKYNRDKIKPNILFITTDCQSWEDLPGITPVLEMPALEKLINESVVFENHYSAAPISMPARYSILSGRYPHYHKMMEDGGNWLPENTPILLDKLSEAGYQTAGIGKMHFKPWERAGGFDFRIIADCQGTSSSDTLKHDDYYTYLKKAGFSRWDYLKFLNNQEIYGVYKWPLNDTLDIDYFVGDETAKLLKSNKLKNDSPWFLWVSFNGPHFPWDSPERFAEKYMKTDLPDARSRKNELNEKPSSQCNTRLTFSKNIADLIDENPDRQDEIVNRIKAGHYGNLSFIDTQIGAILESLRQRKDLDNTIIIFSSAYGALLGDHQNFMGGNFYERSAHVPFMVWWPGHFKKKSVKGFSSHVDIFPTLVELSGGQLPESLDGKSLLPDIAGNGQGDEHSFIEILNNYAVVTHDYKLGIYTPFNEGELYDRIADPDELYNVYNNKKYEKIVDSLTGILIGFNPDIKTIMEKRIEFPPVISAVELKHGDNLRGNKVPFIPGQSLNLLIDIRFENNPTGPIVTYDIDNTHGFSLYIEKGRLYFGIRKFGKETNYLIPGMISGGKYKFKIEIDKEGLLNLIQNSNRKVLAIQTSWPLPVQPGHHECFSQLLTVGVSGDGWIQPYGNLSRGVNLEGNINSCLISVDNK